MSILGPVRVQMTSDTHTLWQNYKIWSKISWHDIENNCHFKCSHIKHFIWKIDIFLTHTVAVWSWLFQITESYLNINQLFIFRLSQKWMCYKREWKIFIRTQINRFCSNSCLFFLWFSWNKGVWGLCKLRNNNKMNVTLGYFFVKNNGPWLKK